MILRHAKNANGALSCDDTFEAIDERTGKTLGSCTILVSENEKMFPNRPYRVLIEINGDPVPDAVLGAAVARAKELARQLGKPARVFTVVDPENTELFNVVTALGLKDNDGIVVLRRDMTDEGESDPVSFPAGCVLVRDRLEDEEEQNYYLQRYSHLYGENFDNDHLQEYIAQKGFTRTILVARGGMAGEITAWIDGDVGRIGRFYVPSKWRRHGICSNMIEQVCADFRAKGIMQVECEIHARVPGVLHTLEKHGFKQVRLVTHYPGADIEPTGVK